eukprot:CCRYP_015024-RG/>CCRYP_015024-RG protein AED:0.06 eAED:0.32 QI:197/0.66/0.5/1/0.66/0.5/4/0/1300
MSSDSDLDNGMGSSSTDNMSCTVVHGNTDNLNKKKPATSPTAAPSASERRVGSHVKSVTVKKRTTNVKSTPSAGKQRSVAVKERTRKSMGDAGSVSSASSVASGRRLGTPRLSPSSPSSTFSRSASNECGVKSTQKAAKPRSTLKKLPIVSKSTSDRTRTSTGVNPSVSSASHKKKMRPQKRAQPPPQRQSQAPSRQHSLSHVSTATHSSFTETGNNSTNPPLEGVPNQEEKERFMMFTRVLMKYLETRNKELHEKAKAQIKECYEKNKSGDPNFASLTKIMNARLHATVGEMYWKKATYYLEHFFLTKKEGDRSRSSSSSKPTSSSGGRGQEIASVPSSSMTKNQLTAATSKQLIPAAAAMKQPAPASSGRSTTIVLPSSSGKNASITATTGSTTPTEQFDAETKKAKDVKSKGLERNKDNSARLKNTRNEEDEKTKGASPSAPFQAALSRIAPLDGIPGCKGVWPQISPRTIPIVTTAPTTVVASSLSTVASVAFAPGRDSKKTNQSINQCPLASSVASNEKPTSSILESDSHLGLVDVAPMIDAKSMPNMESVQKAKEKHGTLDLGGNNKKSRHQLITSSGVSSGHSSVNICHGEGESHHGPPKKRKKTSENPNMVLTTDERSAVLKFLQETNNLTLSGMCSKLQIGEENFNSDSDFDKLDVSKQREVKNYMDSFVHALRCQQKKEAKTKSSAPLPAKYKQPKKKVDEKSKRPNSEPDPPPFFPETIKEQEDLAEKVNNTEKLQPWMESHNEASPQVLRKSQQPVPTSSKSTTVVASSTGNNNVSRIKKMPLNVTRKDAEANSVDQTPNPLAHTNVSTLPIPVNANTTAPFNKNAFSPETHRGESAVQNDADGSILDGLYSRTHVEDLTKEWRAQREATIGQPECETESNRLKEKYELLTVIHQRFGILLKLGKEEMLEEPMARCDVIEKEIMEELLMAKREATIGQREYETESNQLKTLYEFLTFLHKRCDFLLKLGKEAMLEELMARCDVTEKEIMEKLLKLKEATIGRCECETESNQLKTLYEFLTFLHKRCDFLPKMGKEAMLEELMARCDVTEKEIMEELLKLKEATIVQRECETESNGLKELYELMTFFHKRCDFLLKLGKEAMLEELMARCDLIEKEIMEKLLKLKEATIGRRKCETESNRLKELYELMSFFHKRCDFLPKLGKEAMLEELMVRCDVTEKEIMEELLKPKEATIGQQEMLEELMARCDVTEKEIMEELLKPKVATIGQRKCETESNRLKKLYELLTFFHKRCDFLLKLGKEAMLEELMARCDLIEKEVMEELLKPKESPS